jgi:hypothetical protein
LGNWGIGELGIAGLGDWEQELIALSAPTYAGSSIRDRCPLHCP